MEDVWGGGREEAEEVGEEGGGGGGWHGGAATTSTPPVCPTHGEVGAVREDWDTHTAAATAAGDVS